MFYIRCLDREMGYTFDLAEAGLYERAEAEQILREANIGGIHEAMVPFHVAQGSAKLTVDRNELS